MTGIIVKNDSRGPFPANPRLSGETHDSCVNPDCGRTNIDPMHRLGQSEDGSQGSPDRNLYNCDRTAGGCGTSWSRTRAEAAEEDRRKGLNPKWVSGQAMRGTYTSVPSDLYRDRYSLAFGHD